ncbi:hypothetical protein [Pacificibacter sp. AS14]|uniref:hypothetical protein n=1 Tax=Pacificibacter sp. AS14 TaxID=3135785 RepID=UPI00317431BA
MGLFSTMKPVQALTELLEKERVAILKAEFATLAQISASKMSLMKSVAKSSATASELEALKSLTERNRKLLAASAQGFKSARKRLSMLRAPRTTFQTYGPSGSMSDIGHKSLTIKRKI